MGNKMMKICDNRPLVLLDCKTELRIMLIVS